MVLLLLVALISSAQDLLRPCLVKRPFQTKCTPVLLPKHQFRDKGVGAASVPFVQFEEDT